MYQNRIAVIVENYLTRPVALWFSTNNRKGIQSWLRMKNITIVSGTSRFIPSANPRSIIPIIIIINKHVVCVKVSYQPYMRITTSILQNTIYHFFGTCRNYLIETWMSIPRLLQSPTTLRRQITIKNSSTSSTTLRPQIPITKMMCKGRSG